MSDNDLYHWGIKGMKWGVRRYQNKDGSLTPAGRKRRRDDYHEDYNKAHDKKSVKQMSDSELRSRNNRLQMEKQYADLTRKKNKGKAVLTALIATAGTITAAQNAYKVYKDVGKAALDKIGPVALDKIAPIVAKGIKINLDDIA